MSRAAQPGPRWVYRCYDGDGRLLYVGCTVNLFARLLHHKVAAFWARDCGKVVAKVYPDLLSGLAAERAAIRDDQPRFNVVGRWATHATWSVDQYEDYITALNSRPPTHWKDAHLTKVRAAMASVAERSAA